MGDPLTAADWRLFTTLVRSGPVYAGHFTCNLRRIAEYPNIVAYVRDLYRHAGIAATVDPPYIERHDYGSHASVNPTRVVPMGPDIDDTAPHDRARLNKQPAKSGA